MKNNLFCEDRKCPICGSRVKIEVAKMFDKVPYKKRGKPVKLSKVVDITCFNGCYKIETNFSWFHSGRFYRCNMFSIFNNFFVLHNTNSRKIKKEIEKEIQKLISYYKKDFRYIAEILENS